ncbi:unnamed protein product [Cuscuta campestris]|uniref:Uncharacterized protein n=1 Tax=Cuscuta campestris TaxID=132261 RepID=A0A484NE83_9ASTE|nr:unnamed protein product [Cuscuta campestris]
MTPTKVVEGSDAKIPKTFEEYSKEEAAAAQCNDKALNALFGAVDSSQYRIIANCTKARKAWKILETTHEGDERVKTAKYQILMTRFENLRMEDKESITEFHGRVRYLANEAERLGRPFEEDNLVLKVLRALPESYSVDAKAIRQAHDLKRMTLDQLMGNLETIELAMSEEQRKKKVENQTTFQVGDLDLEDEEWMLSTEEKAIEHQVDISKLHGDRTGLGYPKDELTKTPLDLFINRNDTREKADSLPVKAAQATVATPQKGSEQEEEDVALHPVTDLPQVFYLEYHKPQEEVGTTEVQKPGPAPTISKPSPDEPAQEHDEFIKILDEEPLVAVSEVPFQKESEVKKSKKKANHISVPQHRSKRKMKLEEDSNSKEPPQKKQPPPSSPMGSRTKVTLVLKSRKSPHTRFVSSKAKSFFSNVNKKFIIVQRRIDVEDFQLKTNLIPLLEQSKLLKSFTLQGSFVKSVICEFYCNLSESCANPTDPLFH